MRLELLAAKHRSLAVTACEWRAFGLADPDQMADSVFDRLLGNPDPNLADFYAAVDEVVELTYARYAAQVNIVERLTSSLPTPGRQGQTDGLLQALSQLRTKNRVVLQLRYWDGLTEAEAAEALQLSPEAFTQRQAKATTRFLAKVAKRNPELVDSDVGTMIAKAKPGKYVRNAD